MQISTLRGGNVEVDRVARSNGSLLMRNDRSTRVVCVFSFREIELAKTSKDAVIR